MSDTPNGFRSRVSAWIPGWLFPIAELEPGLDHRSRSLHFVTLTYGVLALITAGLLLTGARTDSMDQVRAWVMVFGVVFAWVLYRGRRYQASALVNLLFSGFIITTGVWRYGGVNSLSFTLGGVALIITAGTLFGGAGSGISALGVLALGAVAVLMVPESPRPRPTPVGLFAMAGTILLYITALVSYQGTLLRRFQRLSAEALREREAHLEKVLASDWRLQVTLDGAEVGTWELGPDGALDFSANVPRICRWDGEHFPRNLRGLLAILPGESRNALEEVLHPEGRQEGKPFRVEGELRTPGGRSVWLEWRGQRRSNRNGDGVFLGTLQNIDDRRAVSRQLRESETRWRDLLLGWSGGVLQFGDRGEILHANPAALDLLGLTLLQLNGEDPCPPAWRCHTEAGDRILDLTAWFSVRRDQREAQILVFWSGKGGGPRWVMARVVPGGSPSGFLVEMSDVTGLHRAESAMRQNEARWRETLTGIPDRVIQVDREGKLLFSNRAHWPRTGERWDAQVPPEERGRLEDAVARVFDGGDGEDMDLILESGAVPSAVRIIPVKWEGMVTSLLLMIREGRLSEVARRTADRRILGFISKSPALMYLKAPGGRILFANTAFEDFFGLRPGAWQGVLDREILGEALYERVHQEDMEVLRTGESRTSTVSHDTGDGVRELVVTRFAMDHGGEPVVAAVGTDITHMNRTARELQQAQARLRALADHAAVGMVECDLEHRLLSANPAFCQMLSRTLPSLLGQTMAQLLPQGEWGRLREPRPSPEPRMIRFRTPGGEIRHLHHVWSPVPDGDGNPWRVVHVFQDVTDREEARERLAYLALTDPLTGLHNRRRIMEQLETCLGDGQVRALLLLRLERFEELNRNLGPEVGDRVLMEMAGRLKHWALTRGSFLARASGDGFALLTGPLAEGLEGGWIPSLTTHLAPPLQVDGFKLNLPVQMGLALAPEHGHDGRSLWRAAEGALGVSRRKGTALTVFDPAILRDLPRRQMLLGDMDAHIQSRLLSVVYQPKIRLSDGKAMGLEVLCRWDHPTAGPVSPSEFLPLAEAAHRMTDLTLAVLDQSLAQATAWRSLGYRTPLSVNLSSGCLLDRGFPERLEELLTRHRVTPGDLEFEVNEGAFHDGGERVRDLLLHLSNRGIPLSLDDFGTGLVAMGHLVDLPLRSLKLDASLVRRLTHSTRHGTLVTATIDLAHRLGCEVIAEGVEDEATAKALAGMGCDQAQGWHFARPQSADRLELTRWFSPMTPP